MILGCLTVTNRNWQSVSESALANQDAERDSLIYSPRQEGDKPNKPTVLTK